MLCTENVIHCEASQQYDILNRDVIERHKRIKCEMGSSDVR